MNAGVASPSSADVDRDETGALLGWRGWCVEAQRQGDGSTQGRLRAPVTWRWWPRGVTSAQCLRHRDHVAPAPGCGCGIYAFNEPSPLVEEIDEGRLSRPAAIGLVRGWGRVALHDLGWRAQYVQVLSLFVTAAHPDRIDEMSSYYEVPVLEFSSCNNGGWLEPWL